MNIGLLQNTSRTCQVDSKTGAGFSLLRGAGKFTREEFWSVFLAVQLFCVQYKGCQ